jgi:hypothetical protein
VVLCPLEVGPLAGIWIAGWGIEDGITSATVVGPTVNVGVAVGIRSEASVGSLLGERVGVMLGTRVKPLKAHTVKSNGLHVPSQGSPWKHMEPEFSLRIPGDVPPQ